MRESLIFENGILLIKFNIRSRDDTDVYTSHIRLFHEWKRHYLCDILFLWRGVVGVQFSPFIIIISIHPSLWRHARTSCGEREGCWAWVLVSPPFASCMSTRACCLARNVITSRPRCVRQRKNKKVGYIYIWDNQSCLARSLAHFTSILPFSWGMKLALKSNFK